MSASHAKLGPRLCQAIVMANIVGVACDKAVQALVKQALRRLFLATKAPTRNKISRSLQFATHIDQMLGNAHILLNSAITLGMGNNHLVAAAL